MARTSVSSSFSTVNLSPAKKLDTDFSPIVPQKSLGPAKAEVKDGQETKGNLIVSKEETKNVVNWETMDAFDNNLRDAIKLFVDTTKDGVVLSPAVGGRSKKLDFQFTASPSKEVSPGEIGTFSLVFSYPPGANVASINTSPATSTTTI